MIERMSGTDALLWHMERPSGPMHTLKSSVIDPAQRGAPLTLAEVATDIPALLGLVPRLGQRARVVPGFPGRPFWVSDPDFDVTQHLEEVVAEPPGDRVALDAIHTRLASTPLDLDRPLWAITLVHGLEEGRQAVVVRIHHAVLDGGAALNGLLYMTAEEPAAEPELAKPSADPARPVTDAELRRRVLKDVPALVRELGPLLRDAVRSKKRAQEYRREHPDLPSFAGAPRNFANDQRDDSRICASTDMPLERLKRIAKATDTTINGVYHALIAAALRDELLARGNSLGPCMASFGIAADDGDASRISGNNVTPTTVRMFTEIDDPVRRLVETARSCREGVELRKVAGLDMTGRWANYTCRLTAAFLYHGSSVMRRVNSHVVTANVRGPDHRRWAGPIEITDWISFAVVANPSNINITAHSYAGRMSIGLLVGHGVLSEPRRFLSRMETELDVLDEQLGLGRPSTEDAIAPPDHDAEPVDFGAVTAQG